MRFAKLSELCREAREAIEPGSPLAEVLPYVGLEHIEGDTGAILGTDPAAAPRGLCFRFGPEHVLYAKLRPYLNKVALPEFEGKCSTEAIPLLPVEGVDRTYLALLLRRPQTLETAMQDSTGSRMPRANMKALMQMRAPAPPLPEQRRIVAAMQAVETELAALETRARAQIDDIALMRARLRSDFGWASEATPPAARLRVIGG